MADEILIDRLKRLQEQLTAVYAETLALRAQAEKDARHRHLNDWPDLGHRTQAEDEPEKVA